MYAWIANTVKNPCEEWYVLNEETWECEEVVNTDNENDEDTVLDNEESCTEAGWAWYAENKICILPDAQ